MVPHTDAGSPPPAQTLRARFGFLISSGYATVTAGSAVLLLVLLTIAGRFLSAADYGRFSYALALTTIAETLMDIGLTQVTTRTVARSREGASEFFRHVLGLKLQWIGVGLLMIFVATPLLRPDREIVQLCYVMGFSAAIRSYVLTARGLLQGLDRFDLEAAVVIADRVLLLGLGAAALWTGYGLLGLALAFVAARVAMIAVVGLLLRRVVGHIGPRYDRQVWRDVQAAALPLGFFMIVLNMYTYIDTVILGIMRSDAETGWYAASYRVYEGLTYAPSILAAVLTPRLSYLFVNDRAKHQKMLTRGLLATVVLGAVLGGIALIVSRPLVVLLFGAAYEPAAASLQVLAGGSVFVFATWILHAAAISINLDRRLVGTTAVGLFANVALNIWLIPPFGIRGAAWATVFAEALTVVLLFIQVRKRLAQA